MPEHIEGQSAPQNAARGARFLKSVLWNWLGVAISLITGFVLSPYIIRKIGTEGYGVWTLVFSLIEYYGLLDLGFRSATVKYSAHYRATNEPEKINEIINTGLLYYSFVGIAVFLVTVFFSGSVGRFFQISPEARAELPVLIKIVGISWALGAVFTVFNACLEGFQRFDLASRIWITTMGVRSGASIVALALGYKLTALALIVLGSQILGYFLSFASFRRVFPSQRFSLRYAKLPVMRKMAGYGFHTALASIAMKLLNESVLLLIGHFRPIAYAGYYSLPLRMLQYSADAVSRVAMVTSSNTAELAAKEDLPSIARLAMYVNRYCLILFTPLALFLLAYGHELIRVWIGPEFALHSAPLLLPLVLGMAIAMAGQFNSSAVLYGLGRHSGYARGMLAEAIANFGILLLVIPKFGILGAAWVVSILMIIDRGLYAPWLVCRSVNVSYLEYMRSIYLRPFGAAAPVLAGLWLVKASIPGNNWPQLLAIAALTAASYFGLSFLFCLDREHKALLFHWMRRRSPSAAVASE